MSWLDRIEANICPVSQNTDDVSKALKEWYYTGDTFDLEIARETCQLCDHPNIRYQFVIRNDFTDNALFVGSECITKFGISAVDDSGEWLDEKQTEKKVRIDRNKLITNAKKRGVIKALIALAGADEDFNINTFINYVQDRGAFTPKQLSLVMWRLVEHDIEHRKTDFKMTIKRKRERDQLLCMVDWKVRNIWQCMSQTQRQKYIDKNGQP